VDTSDKVADLDAVFVGDGETARRMRAFDWSTTPLGPVETWSTSLRMMVRLLLTNRFPLRLWRVIVEDVTLSPIFAGTPALAVPLAAGVRAVQSTPLVSRSGRPLGMFSTHYRVPRRPDERALGLADLLSRQVADIIDRARAEAALRASEERFRALVPASSDVVYRMSPDWSEMRHLVGQSLIADTDDPSRTWLQTYIHPDDQAHVMSAIATVIRSKGIFALEHRVRRVDGSLGCTFSRAIPMQDTNGEIVERVGMATDSTEPKLAEAERERLLAAEQDARRRAEEAVWARDVFLSVAAHELQQIS
jgi:PAS domain-containing protein